MRCDGQCSYVRVPGKVVLAEGHVGRGGFCFAHYCDFVSGLSEEERVENAL